MELEAVTRLDSSTDNIGASRRGEWWALASLLAGYALIFLAFYPPIAGVEDEIGFLNQARVWSLGAV